MFRPGGSIKLLRVAGIRIGVDFTWFVILFVMIFWVSGLFRSELNSSDAVAYITTVATVLLFFVSLILHELGHAIAARRAGITVNGIELYLFGGLTQMSRETATPGEEFKVAVAGPLGTLLFGVICAAVDLAIVGPTKLWGAIRFDGSVQITPVLLALSWLLWMNAAILAFNLLPAYPLDGGRIARALVWERTQNKLAGTRAAATLGEWLAVLFAAGGVLLIIRHETFTGVWLVLVAYMIFTSARSTLRHSAVAARMEAVRVADIMDPNPVTVQSLIPASEALEEFFTRYGAAWLPVVDSAGHLLGISRRDRVQAAYDSGEGQTTLASMLDADDGTSRVTENQPLSDLLGAPGLQVLGGVVAVDGDGVVRGIVTLDELRRALTNLMPQPAQRPRRR